MISPFPALWRHQLLQRTLIELMLATVTCCFYGIISFFVYNLVTRQQRGLGESLQLEWQKDNYVWKINCGVLFHFSSTHDLSVGKLRSCILVITQIWRCRKYRVFILYNCEKKNSTRYKYIVNLTRSVIIIPLMWEISEYRIIILKFGEKMMILFCISVAV